MSGFLDALRAVAWRTWMITWRRPVLLTFSLGRPLVWMLFFGFLFHQYQVDLGGVSYLDFLAPGVSVMTVLFIQARRQVSRLPLARFWWKRRWLAHAPLHA